MKIENNQPKVAVLMGGISRERDISIQSGNCIARALQEANLNVVAVDIAPDRLEIMDDTDIDVFFPALHGKFGEDGQLQQILQDKSLIYTGSGPQASRLAFDKLAAKEVFAAAGIDTPDAIAFNPDSDMNKLEKQLQQMGDTYVVKPRRQGSSVGISIVAGPHQAIVTAQKTSAGFGQCIIEKFIAGREVTVSILQDRPLPIVEIKSRTGFYDYNAKYLDEQTEYLFDTIPDKEIIDKLESASMVCFKALGCRHFARVDFILDTNAVAYALELNTIPGFTTHSLLPKAAARAGITMSELCKKIVGAAYLSPVKC